MVPTDKHGDVSEYDCSLRNGMERVVSLRDNFLYDTIRNVQFSPVTVC